MGLVDKRDLRRENVRPRARRARRARRAGFSRRLL